MTGRATIVVELASEHLDPDRSDYISVPEMLFTLRATLEALDLPHPIRVEAIYQQGAKRMGLFENDGR